MVRSALLNELGTPGRSEAYESAVARHVLETINYFALMQLFGGRTQLRDAPRGEVARATLYLIGQNAAEEERARRVEDDARRQSGR